MSPIVRPPYDAELAELKSNMPLFPPLSDKSIGPRRKIMERISSAETVLTHPDIVHEEISITGPGGNALLLSILRFKNSTQEKRPAVYYIHGGGMVQGNRFLSIALTFDWITQCDACVFSVEYRLAPEHPFPAPVEDCYHGLKWLSDNAEKLGIDAEKILIAGASAGGGIAAGTALMARDRGGPKLLAQCLMYPMLDDRVSSVSSLQFMNEGLWTGESNIKAWDWYLQGKRASENVSIYAAPSRATDLSGLPTTWIDVGSAEVFRDENIQYGTKLSEFGVLVEMHIWPGAWHGFDFIGKNTSISKTCLATRLAWVARTFRVVPKE